MFVKQARRGLSVFLFFAALVMVLTSNLGRLLPAAFSPLVEHVISAAHMAGLTQSYMMFAVVGREGTELEVNATTAAGENKNITDAVFFHDGFFNRNFFDHKAGKLIHNLVFSPPPRETFLDYLCRTERDADGAPYKEVKLVGSGLEFNQISAASKKGLYGDRKISLYLPKTCAGSP